MRLVAELIPATGFRVYAGADISAVLTNNAIVWACTCYFPASIYNGVVANVIFIQHLNSTLPTEYRIPLNKANQPMINARGSLNGVGNPVYVGWDKTIDNKPVAYAYDLSDELPSIPVNNGEIAATDIRLPPERWVGAPDNQWIVTDQLIREKFRLSDTLLNTIRKVLVQSGLAKD